MRAIHSYAVARVAEAVFLMRPPGKVRCRDMESGIKQGSKPDRCEDAGTLRAGAQPYFALDGSRFGVILWGRSMKTCTGFPGSA